MVVEANGTTKGDEMLEVFRAALNEFKPPEAANLAKDNEGFFINPYRSVDRYFAHVSEIGRTIFPWDMVKPAFIWKLKIVMRGMELHEFQITNCGTGDAKDFEERVEDKETREFIENKAEEFDGIPFTFQRLCELISTPNRHYHSAEKFFRAIEKNINVVATVNEDGERITGAEPDDDEDMEDINDSCVSTGYVEQKFFLRVDELDGPPEDRPKSPSSSNES